MAVGIWAAPGRVNLVGEHTDYNGGRVLPIALDRTTRVRARLRADGALAFASSGPASGAGYAEGVLAAFRAEGYDVPGLDVDVDSEVPIGAGLSSSAALACAVALAVDDLNGLALARPALARIAQRAENDFVGVPTGGMDQLASLCCTEGNALRIDFGAEPPVLAAVSFDTAAYGLHLLVVDTRVHHDLADGQYAQRRRECEEARRGADTALHRRRARHVESENARVDEVVRRLEAGEVAAIGPVLTQSHASLRDDFEVSCAELDLAVETALAAGALGARMTGGGFGGSAIALTADPERTGGRIVEAFAAGGLRRPSIFSVRAGAGARRLDVAG